MALIFSKLRCNETSINTGIKEYRYIYTVNRKCTYHNSGVLNGVLRVNRERSSSSIPSLIPHFLTVSSDVPNNSTFKAGSIIWQSSHALVGCGSRSNRGLAAVFLDIASSVAPIRVHEVVSVVDVTQMALRQLSCILSFRCRSCDSYRGQTDGISHGILLSHAGRLLRGALESVSRFTLALP